MYSSFIFGTAFKEDMQDEMTITVIAAGFDDDSDTSEVLPENTPEEDIIQIDNPLIDGLGLGGNNAKAPSSGQDYDLDDIFKMLGN